MNEINIPQELNDEQSKFFEAIIDNIVENHNEGAFDINYLLLTGKAGTGKSYLSAALVKYLQQNPISNKNVQCTAMTHKALNELKKKLESVSVNIDDLNGTSTVHSYFKIKASINYKTGTEEFKVENYGPKPKKCSVLFIDEVSMMDETLFNLVKSQKHLYETIVLIGDEFQIPAVNESNYNLFQDVNIKKFKLENIVRQAQDNPIINLASEIVEKIENKDYKDPSFCIKKIIEYSKDNDIITVVDNTKSLVEEYYKYVKDDIGKPLIGSKFYNSFFSTFTNKTVDSLNYVGKSIYKQSNDINYLDPGDLLIMQSPAFDPYLDDVVIFQNNEELLVHEVKEEIYEKIPIYEVYNSEGKFIRVVKPESAHLLEAALKTLQDKAKVNGKLWKAFFDFKKKFAEIKQCFACTIHKAQGSTVDSVFVHLSDLPWKYDIDLAFRLCYVAITRTSNTLVCMY